MMASASEGREEIMRVLLEAKANLGSSLCIGLLELKSKIGTRYHFSLDFLIREKPVFQN